ncbi:nucleoporin Nup43-like [Saccoglossus kowalevskii]|uniref:Nucleoporin Nup43-like n=1 Tax=Saccoglossus kowalevskii TaxID=10224 RepID=A0ABM0MM85_SACKO|nr:PREDICTED: nucleoporin Nup43-like [Saccoglossus kowalevskii]
MADTVVKFVSQKVSKIRWRPVSHQGLQSSDVFVAGSWDDEQNKISMWKCPDIKSHSNEENLSAEQFEPQLLCETLHLGDVTDLKYIDSERLIASSSTGTVTVYRYHESAKTLSVHHNWEAVHRHPSRKTCACTCMTLNTPDIVTVGEDGRIQVLRIEQRYPIRTISEYDYLINVLSYNRMH